jgi:hypothetical protein
MFRTLFLNKFKNLKLVEFFSYSIHEPILQVKKKYRGAFIKSRLDWATLSWVNMDFFGVESYA